MSRKSTQHSKEFKENAVRYVAEHPDLTIEECSKNLGISLTTLNRWRAQYTNNNGDIPRRGSGNYASVEQKDILNEQFNPDRPNAVWCTDITYIWTQAVSRRNTVKPLILHSERGSQYVSKAYRDATERFQLSYSHKGYPYDNACIESFHALIKSEWLDRFHFIDYDHAHRLVFEYIEAFYNTVRIHSHCNYMSPDQFETLYKKIAA